MFDRGRGWQGFPQDKIIASRSVFIAGHIIVILISIFSISKYIFNHLPELDINLVNQELKLAGTAGYKGLGKTLDGGLIYRLCICLGWM